MEEQHAAAILAALNTALAPKLAYDADEVPADRPADYVEVYLTRRFGGESRTSSHKGTNLWRITVRAVSRSSVSNARLMLANCASALEYQRLVVDGRESTPVQFENAKSIGADEGWFTGATNYTYAIATA